MLEWAGDVGGLFDGLRILRIWLMALFATFAMQALVLAKAFIVLRKKFEPRADAKCTDEEAKSEVIQLKPAEAKESSH